MVDCAALLRRYVFNLVPSIWEFFFCFSFLHRSADFDMAVMWYCEGIRVRFNFLAIIVQVTMTLSDTLSFFPNLFFRGALYSLPVHDQGILIPIGVSVQRSWRGKNSRRCHGMLASWCVLWRKHFKKLCASIVLWTDVLRFSFVLSGYSQRLQSVVALRRSEFSLVTFKYFYKYRNIHVSVGLTDVLSTPSNSFRRVAMSISDFSLRTVSCILVLCCISCLWHFLTLSSLWGLCHIYVRSSPPVQFYQHCKVGKFFLSLRLASSRKQTLTFSILFLFRAVVQAVALVFVETFFDVE